MTQLLSYRFRSELARDFHRNITNTQTTTSFATPAGNTVFVYTAGASQTTYSGADTNSKHIELHTRENCCICKWCSINYIYNTQQQMEQVSYYLQRQQLGMMLLSSHIIYFHILIHWIIIMCF